MNEQLSIFDQPAATKTAALVALMRQGGWVSPIVSLRVCRLHALSQQLTKLRARGYEFEDRWAEGQKYKEYRLRALPKDARP